MNRIVERVVQFPAHRPARTVASTSRDETPCALGCGRGGAHVQFVRDRRMPGVLVRVEVDGRSWFVCEPCWRHHGRAYECWRCVCATGVAVGASLRCAVCGLAE